jgi:hypothetical protein
MRREDIRELWLEKDFGHGGCHLFKWPTKFRHPQGPSNTCSKRRNQPIQLPLQCSHQCTPQWTHRLTHRAASLQAPASILAPRPAYQILATCINCNSCLYVSFPRCLTRFPNPLLTEVCCWALFYKTSLTLPTICWMYYYRLQINWVFMQNNYIIVVVTRLKLDEIVTKLKSKLYYDRQSVGQSVLVSDTHLGPSTNFSHSLFDFFLQFRVCWCGTPSLTRSGVSIFQFLQGIANAAFLRSESHGTREHSLLSLFLRLTQPGGPGSCIYFHQKQGSPIISSDICVLYLIFTSIAFISLGTNRVEISFSGRQNQSQSHITTDNQSASPSWCQAPIWDQRPIFLSPWVFRLDSWGLVFCSVLSDERTGL